MFCNFHRFFFSISYNLWWSGLVNWQFSCYQYFIPPKSIIMSTDGKSYKGCTVSFLSKNDERYLVNETTNSFKTFQNFPNVLKCLLYILVYILVKRLKPPLCLDILDIIFQNYSHLGSLNCSKYLYSKCRIKHFWENVSSKVWHSFFLYFFIIELNINVFRFKFDFQIQKYSHRINFILFFELKLQMVSLFTIFLNIITSLNNFLNWLVFIFCWYHVLTYYLLW